MICISFIVNAQQPVQTIRGVVRDAKTHEKLFGANVILPEENRGTITDVEGRFSLHEVKVGRYNLQVSFVGYKPVIIPELLVGSGKEIILEIDMEPSISKLDEIVIKPTIRKDLPVNSMASVSARTFSVEEAGRYAGALDDPGRMAGNFAGVTTAGVNVNAIVVRGNAPKGLLWRLEGVDIPVPSHFSGSNVAGGGALTMFSSELLANSDFYTGAFPAEFGNATAGVFDMKLRNGNNRNREYSFQIGVQGIEAAAEGPFKKGGKGSYLLNYRYSTMALIFPLLPELEGGDEIPVYQDLSFKINIPGGKAGSFSFWGIGGLSSTNMRGYDDPDKWIYPESRAYMDFHYNMGATGITHTLSLSENTLIRSTLALNAGEHSYYDRTRLLESSPSEIFPLFSVDKTEGKGTLSSVITHVYNSRLTIKGGLDLNRHFYELKGEARNFESQTMEQLMNGDGQSWMIKGHVQGKYLLSDNSFFTAGLNTSWFELNDEYRIEPRASFHWEAFPGHRFSLGYGIHSQIEPLFVYFVRGSGVDEQGENEFPNKNLGRMGAHHFVLGYDWSITPNLRLKIEPYYQKIYDVPVVDGTPYSMVNFLSDWTFDRSLINEGSGINMGVDVTLERFLKDGLYYMTTMSIYDSKYTGGDGIERRTRYDGGYVMNILGGKEWLIKEKNLFSFNLKLTFMGPYWYQPLDIEATHQQKDIVYDEDQAFNYRYSNFETMSDLSLNYRINGKKVSSIITLQVKNILGGYYMGKKYNLEKESIENDFFKSLVPFLSYEVEF